VIYRIKNLTAVDWRSIILAHNCPPSGTTASYEKLLSFSKRQLSCQAISAVNKTSPNVKKKFVENFICLRHLKSSAPEHVFVIDRQDAECKLLIVGTSFSQWIELHLALLVFSRKRVKEDNQEKL
jgi:hypothetical protein